MWILDSFEHFLEILIVEMDQDGAAMWAIKGVLRLRQVMKQLLGLNRLQMMVGLDRQLARQHDRGLLPKMGDADLPIA